MKHNVHRTFFLTLTTLVGGATFAVACGDEDKVSTNSGVARAAPRIYGSADALEGAALSNRYVPRVYGSADAFEHNTLNRHTPIYVSADAAERAAERAERAEGIRIPQSADALERAALDSGPFEPDTVLGAK